MGHDGSRKKAGKQVCIHTGVQQHSEKQAAVVVVENPGENDGQRYANQAEDGKVLEERGKARPRAAMLSRRQKMRKMPACPKHSQQQGSPQWTITPLQPR